MRPRRRGAVLRTALVRSRTAQLVAVTGLYVYTSANAYLSAGLGAGGRAIGLSEVQVGMILGFGALAGVVTHPGDPGQDIAVIRQLISVDQFEG